VLRLRTILVALPLLALGAGDAAAQAPFDPNPCLTLEAARLRCPDFTMRRPFDLRLQRTRGGRRLLRAGNSLDNVGRGPVELHGVRRGRSYYMRGRQRIYRRGRGRIAVWTGARLYFKYAHARRRWWKFLHAASFELWRVNSAGRRTRRVRRGPKVSYCLRDLRRTHGQLRRSPRRRVYPACDTSRRARRVTIGTSVGWSDIYPAGYPEQWIDVTGLRGCFAYDQVADPRNGVYESNERNNRARVIVRLPFRPGRQRCRGGSSVGGGGPSDPY
jgi:Lysyl oxidase